MKTTELLIIGAGPFGLAVAVHAKLSGTAVTIVGEQMAFWKHNMPAGMRLPPYGIVAQMAVTCGFDSSPLSLCADTPNKCFPDSKRSG